MWDQDESTGSLGSVVRKLNYVDIESAGSDVEFKATTMRPLSFSDSEEECVAERGVANEPEDDDDVYGDEYEVSFVIAVHQRSITDTPYCHDPRSENVPRSENPSENAEYLSAAVLVVLVKMDTCSHTSSRRLLQIL